MTQRGGEGAIDPASPPVKTALLVAGAGVAVLVFLGLGGWQLERRVWKLSLIAQTNSRVRAAEIPAPGPADLAGLPASAFVYRPVAAQGRFLNTREAHVQALSALGPGYWVLTPLVTSRGFTVLVNRGFVPDDKVDAGSRSQGQIAGLTTVHGLMRASEPRGGFLHRNDPAAGRWYSRDVPAIAGALGLQHIAPYFIDAGPTSNPGGWPVGGLTVIRFANSHLVYALTWFSMAGAVVVLTGAAIVQERSRRSSAAAARREAARNP